MLILDLCGGTGAWSAPYRNAGYHTLIIDPAIECIDLGIKCTVEQFIKYPHSYIKKRIHGIIAAPPCTEFARSGARWWKDKNPQLLADAITTVQACLKAIDILKPHWWVLENPVGRLARMVPALERHTASYQPWEYGDPYTKRTCLWGQFTMPPKTPVYPSKGSKLWHLGPSPERAKLRSITPTGFANAFYKANP